MRAALALFVAPLALAGCDKPKDVSVDHAWIRLAPLPSRPAAAYFTIHGGPTDQVLVDAASALAIRSEMHETVNAGGVSQMRPIRDLPIPARTEVKFAPGGRHLMLFDLSPEIKPGTRVPITLTFGNLERIEVFANTIAAGDPAP